MSGDAAKPNPSRNGPRFALMSFVLLFACMVAGDALARLHYAGQPILGILGRSVSTAALVTVLLWFLRLKRPG